MICHAEILYQRGDGATITTLKLNNLSRKKFGKNVNIPKLGGQR
jgi:hypothetical protein